MCILFVLLLINKSWHLAVLSFSCPPSFPPLHLDFIPLTTCLPPFFYTATLFCTLTFSYSLCTAVFLRLWLGPALGSGHSSDEMPCSAPKLLRPAQAWHAKPTGRADSDTVAKVRLSSFHFCSLLQWWFWQYDLSNWTCNLRNPLKWSSCLSGEYEYIFYWTEDRGRG